MNGDGGGSFPGGSGVGRAGSDGSWPRAWLLRGGPGGAFALRRARACAGAGRPAWRSAARSSALRGRVGRRRARSGRARGWLCGGRAGLPRPAPYMGGAGESRAGVDRIACGGRLRCELGGPALHGRSRWRRRRSDWGCGGSFQTGATLLCRALCWSAPQTLPSVGPCSHGIGQAACSSSARTWWARRAILRATVRAARLLPLRSLPAR